MPSVLALEDAKINQIRHPGKGGVAGGIVLTPFFGSRNTPDFPQAYLSEHAAGGVSGAHFHALDQFQVVVGGKGKIGRHNLTPYCVHFSRAYTPYGPLVADTHTSLIFFGLRPHYDLGSSQHLPQALDKLKQVPDRNPWQITCPVTFPTLPSDTATGNSMLQEIPGIKDDKGLAGYTLSMKPNAATYGPDPSHGNGQYLIVVKGSLLHNNKEHKALSLVLVESKESAYQICAGPDGLDGIILNFPQSKARALSTATPSFDDGPKKWQW